VGKHQSLPGVIETGPHAVPGCVCAWQTASPPSVHSTRQNVPASGAFTHEPVHVAGCCAAETTAPVLGVQVPGGALLHAPRDAATIAITSRTMVRS